MSTGASLQIVKQTGVIGLALLGVLACGADQKSATNGSLRPTQSENLDSPSGALVKQTFPPPTRVQSPKLLDRRARSALAPDTLESVRSIGTVPRSQQKLYRRVAPATVIVRSSDGIGSGVIVDPAGWVLTNHHVVEGGTAQDFQIKVRVLLGAVEAKSGRMRVVGEGVDGYVHKVDRLRDLALVKLVAPPANLEFVPLAKDDPMPGQQVASVGHAGAARLWAVHQGEVSSLGKLDELLGALVRFGNDPPGREAAERLQAYLGHNATGTLLQSTCDVLPGESGGPLVNTAGELVGLNAYSDVNRKTGKRANYQISRSVIAKFLEERPEAPARLLPDAWLQGGGDASFEDVDGNGRVDVLRLKGRRPCRYCPRQSQALFLDVDEDSFGNDSEVPSLPKVFENRAFDAEVVFLRLERTATVWYDTDNDGDFDVLLVDDGNTGRSSAAYRLRAGGRITPWPSLADGRTVRFSLLQSQPFRERLGLIADAAFPGDFVEASTAWQGAMPDPIGTAGYALVGDLNFDGTNDGVQVDSAFGERLLIDADQNWAAGLAGKGRFSELLSTAPADVEMSVVSQGTSMWVWYDTDDDGTLDLVLHAPQSRHYVATSAWSVTSGGEPKPLTEHVGRKLVRPDLLQVARVADAVRSMVKKKSFLPIMSSRGNAGLSSFPDPVKDHRGTTFEWVDLPGGGPTAVMIQGRGSDGYLLDLDGNSLEGRPRPTTDVGQLVRDGKFDAEVAYFHRNGLAWTYYDTNDDGGYDLVLYTAEPSLGVAAQAYRIEPDQTVLVDSSSSGKKLISPSLLESKRMRSRLEDLGRQLFAAKLVE